MKKATAIIRLGAAHRRLDLHDGSAIDLHEIPNGELHKLSNGLSNALGITGDPARPARRGHRRNKGGLKTHYGRRQAHDHH